MGYKITTKDKNQKMNLWDAQSEALIAQLALRLSTIRDVDATKVTQDLNYKYLRKRANGNKKNYAATLLQRSILNEYGY